MTDLVVNPEDRFSRVAAHMISAVGGMLNEKNYNNNSKINITRLSSHKNIRVFF